MAWPKESQITAWGSAQGNENTPKTLGTKPNKGTRLIPMVTLLNPINDLMPHIGFWSSSLEEV